MDMMIQLDVVQYGYVVEDFDFLKSFGNFQGSVFVRLQVVNLLIFVNDIVFLWVVKIVDVVYYYGFVGIVGVDDGMDFVFLYFQVDVGQGVDFVKGYVNVIKF